MDIHVIYVARYEVDRMAERRGPDVHRGVQRVIEAVEVEEWVGL